MKFLIPHWYTYSLTEIIKIFQEKGHIVHSCTDRPRNWHYDPVFRKRFTQDVAEQNIEAVFSLQYFPILSNLCEKLQIPYICWCYSNPVNHLLLTESLTNSCNTIFHTDSRWVEKLQRSGAQNVHFLPWAAAGASTLNNPPASDDQADISLVDNTEQEAWLSYLALTRRLDERTRGFLDGLLQAQRNIYGSHLLEKVLHSQILTSIQAALPLKVPRGSIASPEETCAFQMLYPAVTKMETDYILTLLDREVQWHTCFYTAFPRKNLLHINQRTVPDAENTQQEMNLQSRIHLLIPPRQNQNGIPVQAMDILGSGNLLLTCFQKDYLLYFEPGRDYACYESPEDMIDKARYYLLHPEERDAITERARKKILQSHTMAHRVREMFTLLGLSDERRRP